MIRLTFAVMILVFGLTIPAFAEVALTVYNNDQGLVRETRTLTLDEGTHEVTLTDVAARIDTTSVKIKSLTDPATRVLEQNFRYDGLMLERMLVNFLDREIRIIDRAGIEHNGQLLAIGETTTPTIQRPNPATSNDLILLEQNQHGKKIVLVEGGPKQILVPAVDQSLVLVPTLAWLVNAEKAGEHTIELSYLTGGISWSADYTLVFTDESDKADLNGWVTLTNHSGADYLEAKLKLVAGDVNRVQEHVPQREVYFAKAADVVAQGAFVERGMFEYHLYELQRPADVLNNEQKQVELLSAPGIQIERRYIYDVNRDAEKVSVELRFKNEEANQLGIPLPKGRIRTFSKDADETMQFVGEASIDHTPKDEKIELEVGKSFDLRGERRIVETKDSEMFGQRTHTETVEIKLRNHKDKAATIRVREQAAQGARNWEIVKSTHKYEKKDAFVVEFPIDVQPNGEVVLTYTIERSWPM